MTIAYEQLDTMIRKMQKMDLHVHLNGAVPTPLVKDLLSHYDCVLPDGYNCQNDLQVLAPVISLRDYFRPWLALKQLPVGKVCLTEMMKGAVDYLRTDGVTYVEFRNSPFNIATLNNISLQETVEWLAEAAATAEEQLHLQVRLILSVSRYGFDIDKSYSLLDSIQKANGSKYVVGVDLSGDEDTTIPSEICGFFKKAKDELGLSVTIHAGETGNHENIEWAILECGADRIGHALAAINCSKTADLIIDRDVCVEVCLQSNLRTGAVKCLEEHPVVKFLDLGIPFVLCSDNPAIHGTTLSDDYNLFRRVTGREDILEQMLEQQKRYAFSGD